MYEGLLETVNLNCLYIRVNFMDFTGSSGQQFSDLSSGEHRLKIVTDNCGRNRRPLVVRFTVEGEEA